MTRARHKWSEPARSQYRTERWCEKCGLKKVTRHEPGEFPWIEWYRGRHKIDVARTPACIDGGLRG